MQDELANPTPGGAESPGQGRPGQHQEPPPHHHEQHLHVPDIAEINKAAGRDLPAALLVGVGLTLTVVLTLLYWNWGFILLVGALLTLGTIELHHALLTLGMRTARVPIAIGTFLTFIAAYYFGQPDGGRSALLVIVALVSTTVVVALIWRMPGGAQGFVKDTAASLFVIAYVQLLGSFVSLMLASPDGPSRLYTMVLIIIASDTGGYIAGVLFGRHAMAPLISPKKTWEGMVGSVVLSSTIGVLLAVYLLHIGWWAGLLLGLVLVAFGTAGDLIESMIKRDVGIKDMSSVLPGHGGVMDRLDSMIVGAPVAWLLLLWLLPIG